MPRLEELTAELQLHGAALRALGRGLLDADDLLQDACLAALQAPPPRHLRAWFAGTLRRLAAARRRRDARRRQREQRAARPEAVASAADTAAAAEVAHRIAAAVADLHEPYRSAVVLRFWHGLEPQPLGERLGVPTNTARSRVQRGLELLRTKLSEGQGGRAAWAAPLSTALSALGSGKAAALIPLGSLWLAMKTKLLFAALLSFALVSAWFALADRPVAQPDAAAAAPLAAASAAATPPDPAPASLDRRVAPPARSAGVRVHVVDEHGTSMPGVLVGAFLRNTRSATAFTDADGRAQLPLPSGEFFLTADYGDFAAKPRHPDLHCNGTVVHVDATLLDVPLVLERFCCLVRARVVDDLSVPVEGIAVHRTQNTGGSTPDHLTTDADGIATFDGLPPGTSFLRLDDSSPPPGCRVAISTEMLPYTVTRDGSADVEFRLDRLSTVRLRLRNVDAAAATVWVDFHSPRYSWRHGLIKEIKGGELTFPMPPGDCEASVRVAAEVAGLFRGSMHFTVGTGEDRVIDIPLEPAAGVLKVDVVDEHGAPLAGAAVTALGLDPKALWSKIGWTPDAQGAYQLHGIPDEPLHLLVEARAASDRNLAFLDGTDTAPWLELSGPQRVTVVLREAYAIRGVVVGADGKPLAEGDVSRGRAAGTQADRTRLGFDLRQQPTASGSFEFRWLRPGKYPLWIGNQQEGPPDAEVEVGPDVTPSHVAEVVLHQHPEAKAK